MFNGGEVDYLTVKHNDKFHIFSSKDVIDVFGEFLEVCNSQARRLNETPEQKVLFRYGGVNLGELEMRNSNYNHYREVLFVMNKLKVLNLLFDKIPFIKEFNEKVLMYGSVEKKFNRKK